MAFGASVPSEWRYSTHVLRCPVPRLLKHGTRETAPEDVAACEVGLDFRYSRAGLFGKGAYCAEDAAYVDKSFAYRRNPAAPQMFLVRVAAGSVFEAPSTDNTIVHPPKGFDSIRGTVAANHKAIMAYDLNQASVPAAACGVKVRLTNHWHHVNLIVFVFVFQCYPCYLITYAP